MDEGLAGWCRRWLGAAPVAVLFRAGYLSEVTGLRLADGREVVLKARPPAPRLRGCLATQAALAGAGFPCPRPLAGPAPLGRLAATAEELVPGGDLLAPGPDAAGRFAALLAELVRLAPAPATLPTLAPSPPWAAWDHDRPGLWPLPDDHDGDLDDHPGPAWLDRVAAAARARLAALRLPPPVVGHADWESQNIRWRGARRPLAISRPSSSCRLRAGQGPRPWSSRLRARPAGPPASGSGPSTPRSSTWPAAAPTWTASPPRSPNAPQGPALGWRRARSLAVELWGLGGWCWWV